MWRIQRGALHTLTRLGAKARLAELRSEEAAIRKAFPNLSGGGRQAAGAGGAAARKRRPMSDEKCQELSERMKKYWAVRRKTKR